MSSKNYLVNIKNPVKISSIFRRIEKDRKRSNEFINGISKAY